MLIPNRTEAHPQTGRRPFPNLAHAVPNHAQAVRKPGGAAALNRRLSLDRLRLLTFQDSDIRGQFEKAGVEVLIYPH